MKNFIEEVTWRGMLHDVMPGTGEHLMEQMRVAYVGIDPTADSLHIGHLVGVMLLKHFQLSGHKPLALVGGATGMIGDPSGKSNERNLLDETTLAKNIAGVQSQLSVGGPLPLAGGAGGGGANMLAQSRHPHSQPSPPQGDRCVIPWL